MNRVKRKRPQTAETQGVQPSAAWHPEDIKAAVRKAHGSLAELARRHGVSECVVQAAVSRVQPSGNRIIADALGHSVHEIWPHLFDETGNVRRPRPENGKRRESPAHRQNAAAA